MVRRGRGRMLQIRGSAPFAIALSCALWAITPQVRAADQGITGKQLLLKSSPKLIVLSKDPGISITGSDPVGSDSSITFDDGTNTATWDLPAGNWTKNSSGTLFKYKNSSAPSGPSAVKIAKLKSGLLKVVAKGLPIPVPNGAATINVVLNLDGGTNTYCMTFAGMGDGSKFLVNDAPAGACAAPATPTPTATPSPTPRLPDIPPPGPAPLRYRDLVFSTVTTTSNVTYGIQVHNSGTPPAPPSLHGRPSGGCTAARSAAATRPRGRSSTKRPPSRERAISTSRSTIASNPAAAPRAAGYRPRPASQRSGKHARTHRLRCAFSVRTRRLTASMRLGSRSEAPPPARSRRGKGVGTPSQ